MMPYLVEGWTDDDRSASSHWTNTEYHSCEVGRTRYVTSQDSIRPSDEGATASAC
jgi:hypothetical protein